MLFEPAERSDRSRRFLVLTYAAAFVAITGLSLLRQTGPRATSTLWAEDGEIFYSQALSHSIVGAMFTPYAGYLQLFPRLTFALVHFLPVADIAGAAALVGAASLAALSLFVFHASRGLIPSVIGRSLLVGAMVFLPLATGELLNNVVNVPWWLFFATFWALVWRPRTPGGMVVAGLICLLSVGSDPLVVLFLPLALARLYVVGWRECAAPLGLVLGLAYQVVGIFRPGHQSAFPMATTHGIFRVVATKLGLGWITGDRVTNDFAGSASWVWPALGLLLLLAILVFAIALRQRRLLVFVATSLAFAVLVLAVPVWVRGAGPMMATSQVLFGSRYLATPILLVWGAVIAEATSIPVASRPAGRYLGVVLCCALLLPFWVIDFRTPNDRSDGTLWSTEVAQARIACRHRGASPQHLSTSPPGWYTMVPCSDL